MKPLGLIKSLIDIAFAVYLFFNWYEIPYWLMIVICISFALEGVNPIIESFNKQHHEH